MLFDDIVKHSLTLDSVPTEDQLYETADLGNLFDIRNSSAYKHFVDAIGGFSNLNDNGYLILAIQYKRELKYITGNLM